MCGKESSTRGNSISTTWQAVWAWNEWSDDSGACAKNNFMLFDDVCERAGYALCAP